MPEPHPFRLLLQRLVAQPLKDLLWLPIGFLVVEHTVRRLENLPLRRILLGQFKMRAPG